MNSFISWIGGKNYLKKVIAAKIPVNLERYVEVFGGAAWVLFYRNRYATTEIYNDFDSNLTNLFRCVKYHGQELQRELMWVLNSREVFDDYRAQLQICGLTDIQRAARFFLLIRLSYGSNVRTYGCVKKDVLTMYEYLTRVQGRLSTVIIENKDFENLIKVYDRQNTFFYLDPPYYGTEHYYQGGFGVSDHERLLKCIQGMKGQFILSYNDCAAVRDLYKGFKIESVSRVHNLRARYSKGEEYKELLISN
ncbi:MAG TPA: DNA adenine methylase [Syntrophomonadaceae bacterium]|nr:DNA adenine methylase [Syntrophomonadaceae bacterium]